MPRCRVWLVLAVAILVGAVARGAVAPQRQRLASGWEYHQGALGGVWEVWRGEKASDNVTWQKVELPHCFNARDAVDPDVHYYQGPGWYRARLKLANPFPGGRTLLHFEGAGQKTQVFVGMEAVGPQHLGGYDQFTVDITPAAARASQQPENKGLVPVAVLCDNSRDLEMIPSDLSDFTRYGGIYRHLNLEYVPAISLERAHVESSVDPKGEATASIRARLYNPAALSEAVRLKIEVFDPQGKSIYTSTRTSPPWPAAETIGQLSIEQPKLWSPSQPALYRCVVTLASPHGEMQVAERFGLRWFEFLEHGPFQLNGQRLPLRGTHYHEDHAGVGAALSDDMIRRTIQMIKDVGANFVRLGHYQQSPLVLDLCDELGLLVWEEIPWCRGGLGGPRYQQQARDMLRAMIDQHHNHPSVIIWGLGNENDWPGDFEVFDKDRIRAFMSELNALAHQLDPSRKTAIRRCDFCKDVPDVYAPSIWAGWYGGHYSEYRSSSEKEIKGVRHFLHAEYGGDSHALRHSEDPDRVLAAVATGQGTEERGLAYLLKGGKARASKDGDWSESYICNLFDWHLKEQEQIEGLTGAAQWIFKDFATPLRPENPVPRVNQKGLVERDLTPKEGYYVFQSYWAEKPMVHIYGHTWPIRWGKPGEEKTVKVYSNCPQVELFVNGKSAGVKQRDSRDFPAAGLRWMCVLKEGRNTLRAVGRGSGSEVVDEITVAYQTARWEKPAKLVFEEFAHEGDTVTAEVRALDQQGVMCLDARNLVRFGLAGDGQLLDNLGTSTGSRVVQLYNGRALIGVKLNGGKSALSVSSAGLRTAFLNVAPPEGSSGSGAGKGSGGKGKKSSGTGTGSSSGAGSSPPANAPAKMGRAVLTLNVAEIDRRRILQAAAAALGKSPVSITRFPAALSEGGPNDFYSNGDYWWPDPAKPNGLPYVRRDGQSNPQNFAQHRLAVKELRDAVAVLAAAYKLTGEEKYPAKAAEFLRVFFLDPATRMNPHLRYAQAIPGRSPGRGTGIIDALHLVEVARAIQVLEKSPALTAEAVAGLKRWFGDLAEWMTTHPNGVEEMNAKNNHAVAYFLQLAVFARLVGDEEKLAFCRQRYKQVFLTEQMAPDGSFPLELERTKPYGYSIFQLDNMATLCQVLSQPGDDLWTFELPDGRGIRKAMAFLYPYLQEKSKWPYRADVEHFDGWPARQVCLLLAGLALGELKYLDLWKTLPPDPTDTEVQRNIALTQPILWLR